MPRLRPQTEALRREHILDAAERCFARSGFHGTTMQDICRAAEVSPGALYIYFASKERLISGIVERDRMKLESEVRSVAEAPDLMSALERLADHYMHEEPDHKRALCLEIGAEATRNPAIGAIFRQAHAAVHRSFVGLFERARMEGRIAPSTDIETLTLVIHLIGDGLYWRRAVDPDFNPRVVMPTVMTIVKGLLDPRTAVGVDRDSVALAERREVPS